MLKKYRKNLENLGLSEKESRVYLTLLNEGNATADQTAKLSGLNRSTTYVQIETLMKIGLVTTFKRGKKTFFAAESPNNLKRILEQKSLELKQKEAEASIFLPQLMKVFANTGVRPVIRTFEGKEGLISMRNEILESKIKELYACFDFDELYKLFTKDELMEFSNTRAKKKMKSYLLYCKTGEDAILVPPQEMKRVVKDCFPFPSDVYIYGDSVSIACMKDHVVGITIENAEVAQSFKSLFKLAWKSQDK